MVNNTFAQAAKVVANLTKTENGHIAASSTGSAVLNLYGQVGALRGRPWDSIKSLINQAVAEDKLLTAKTMFYARDARQGTGERTLFREMLVYLAREHPEMVLPNVDLIPFYGRWDDMYALVYTPAEDAMWKVMREQLKADLKALEEATPEHPADVSLLGKWLKSCNSSSKETCTLGRLTYKKLGYKSEAAYRRDLTKLRKAIRIVEADMSAKRWSDIEYDKLPSRAGMIYRKAFKRHDPERYDAFVEAVMNGEKAINAAMNTPQDITHAYMKNCMVLDPTLEAMWKNLPDFVQSDENVLCLVDVSGSMYGRPIEVSTGLGMYFAQKSRGAFHNLFLTFETEPKFVQLRDNVSLAENLKVTLDAPWGGSTNLNKACEEILKFARKHNVPNDEMPTRLIIISDMEIDEATNNRVPYYRSLNNVFDANDVLNIHEIQEMYAQYGYTVPQVIYWNVDSRDNHFHTRSDIPGTMLASGSSPAVFKAIMAIEDLDITPMDAMLEVLNGERYSPITVE